MANLIIDIGNTRAKLTVFEGTEPVETVNTDNGTLSELPAFVARHCFEYAIVGSVVDVTPEARQQIEAIGAPVLWFGPDTPVPLVKNTYRTPRTLGADRLAAVLGAMLVCPGQDVLVVDAGTCITYDLLSRDGRYLGGNISPGMYMRLMALHEHTGRLPLVEASGSTPPLGYDTETAIRSGVKHGIEHEIVGFINQVRISCPSLVVYLTGGDCLAFDANTRSILRADSYLVARGLNCILMHNYESI